MLELALLQDSKRSLPQLLVALAAGARHEVNGTLPAAEPETPMRGPMLPVLVAPLALASASCESMCRLFAITRPVTTTTATAQMHLLQLSHHVVAAQGLASIFGAWRQPCRLISASMLRLKLGREMATSTATGEGAALLAAIAGAGWLRAMAATKASSKMMMPMMHYLVVTEAAVEVAMCFCEPSAATAAVLALLLCQTAAVAAASVAGIAHAAEVAAVAGGAVTTMQILQATATATVALRVIAAATATATAIDLARALHRRGDTAAEDAADATVAAGVEAIATIILAGTARRVALRRRQLRSCRCNRSRSCSPLGRSAARAASPQRAQVRL